MENLEKNSNFYMKNLNQYIYEKLVISKNAKEKPSEIYFYHEALEDGYITEFIYTGNILQYSIDNCQTWHELDPKTHTPEINEDERIYFKGKDIKTNIIEGMGFFSSNKKFNVGGNIMSLIYGDDFKGKTKLIENHQFDNLFNGNKYVVSAKDLVLPATELTGSCYSHMFFACKSLKEAPKLPATKLVDGCYECMFANCTSLTEAPELTPMRLVDNCYRCMFNGCYSLKEITMLALDISAHKCLSCFLPASSLGLFIKAKGANIPIAAADNLYSGMPEDWSVKEI